MPGDPGPHPIVVGGVDYATDALPLDADELTAITETAFRKAFDEPEDFGTWALFSSSAMAASFYLQWSYMRED